MSHARDLPAFPREEDGGPDRGMIVHYGMSLRDYFAAKALDRSIGIIAEFVDREEGRESVNLSEVRDRACKLAYSFADAMLAERAK